MQKLCCYMVLALAVVLSQGCGKTELYSYKAKTVDSLSTAIHTLVKELEKTDTILLQKAIARFNDYRQFIALHVQDTILKEEADNLQHFYAGGLCLESFPGNRRAILLRAALIHSQLEKLSQDIKNKSQEPEQFSSFIERERLETARLMEAGYEQQRRFHSGFGEFKNSLNGVESLIRSRNRGELPTIIKDSVNL